MAPADLAWCGPSCWGNAVLGVVEDAVGIGKDAFDSTLNLAPDVLDFVNSVKHGAFDEWAEWVKSAEGIGRDIVNGMNAAYDGIIEISKASWELMKNACSLFAEYKEYINIGVQVIQGDYANAAANLAEEASAAMGLPQTVQGTDAQIIQAAEFICRAIDGIAIVAAAANGVPAPPPIGPADTLVVVDGVARKRTAAERLAIPKISFNPDIFAGTAQDPTIPVPQAKKSVITPTIIIGAGAAVAIFLVSR